MTLDEANNKEMALKKVIKTWLNQVDK